MTTNFFAENAPPEVATEVRPTWQVGRTCEFQRLMNIFPHDQTLPEVGCARRRILPEPITYTYPGQPARVLPPAPPSE